MAQHPTSSGSDQPKREVVSFGAHAGEVENYVQAASHDQLFTPLMVDAGFIPEELRGARILPGVTYGIDATRPTPFGAVEVLPGPSALLRENTGTAYFNPHLSVRTRAHNLVDHLTAGKGKSRVRGQTFGLPSYILDNYSDRYLFVGGSESDLEIIGNDFAEKLAKAYHLGHVVLGSEVAVGSVKTKLGHVSLPTLVREIGQTISDFDLSHAQKVEILKQAHRSYEEGQSPDYRPYLRSRKHWPTNRQVKK